MPVRQADIALRVRERASHDQTQDMAGDFNSEVRERGRCGYIGDGRDTPCGLVEGWGYENTESGLCRHHGDRGAPEGNQNAVGNSGGSPPENNGNGETHTLRSDPGPYYERQSNTEQDRIDGWAESWTRRGGYEGLGFDKLFRTHATKLHQVESGDEYIAEKGTIVQRVVARTEDGRPIRQGEENPAFSYQSRTLKDIMRFLKEFGCLDDPDSQQAEATAGIIAILSGDGD